MSRPALSRTAESGVGWTLIASGMRRAATDAGEAAQLSAAGVQETWTADPFGMARPLRISVTGPNQLSWNTGNYAYDGAGNITAIGTRSFTYDPSNRLTAWTDDTATRSTTVRRQLDPFGNYINTEYSGCSKTRYDCFTSATTPFHVDAASNHYTEETYDHAGNVVADYAYTYSYDAASMLTALAGGGRNEQYLYTAGDERIAVVDLAGSKTTWTLRGTDNKLLRTFTRNSVAQNTGWSWTEDEVWRGSQLLASESPTGRKQYHLDHLGSPRLVTDTSGVRIGEQTFEPFGEGGTSDGGRLQFTGHERDNPPASANGHLRVLDYMHARYYSAGVGRFLSVDPVVDAKRASKAPQMWNRYAYALNNPMRYVDPDGRFVQVAGTQEERERLLELIRQNLLQKDRKLVTLGKSGILQIAANAKGSSIAFTMLKNAVRDRNATVGVAFAQTALVKSAPGPGKPMKVDLQTTGGGLTTRAAHTLSGNIEVRIDPRGDPQGQPLSIVMGHELLGHAWDLMFVGTSSEHSATLSENYIRRDLGMPLRLPVPTDEER